MKRFVIVETLKGVSETIIVFHEVKIDVTLGGGNYSSLKSIIFSSSSPTLFFSFLRLFSLPFPNFKKWEVLGRNLGGTWEERFRFTFVTSLLSIRYQSEVLSKTKRSSIEDLSNIYRTSIEHLSNIYRRPIEDLSKRACVNCFIHLHMVCLLRRRMDISPSIFFLTNDSSVRSL